MKTALRNMSLWIFTGLIIILIPILYSYDTPVPVSAPHVNLQEIEAKEKEQQEEQARVAEEARRRRIVSCTENDDCIIVDKDPCGCLIGPKGVTAINALYTLDFDKLQTKSVTKACPETEPSVVRECAPTARAACVKKQCKIVY
jgi:predicted phosphoribosyltransferase